MDGVCGCSGLPLVSQSSKRIGIGWGLWRPGLVLAGRFDVGSMGYGKDGSGSDAMKGKWGRVSRWAARAC